MLTYEEYVLVSRSLVNEVLLLQFHERLVSETKRRAGKKGSDPQLKALVLAIGEQLGQVERDAGVIGKVAAAHPSEIQRRYSDIVSGRQQPPAKDAMVVMQPTEVRKQLAKLVEKNAKGDLVAFSAQATAGVLGHAARERKLLDQIFVKVQHGQLPPGRYFSADFGCSLAANAIVGGALTCEALFGCFVLGLGLGYAIGAGC